MSSKPIRFPAPGKEIPFDDTQVRRFISDLMVRSAQEVESEQLEIKGWCKDERELAEKVSEACTCIANTSGGFVLIGVEDGLASCRKFSPCPYPVVNTLWIQTNVHNLTHPAVDLVPFDASGLLSEMLGYQGNNLYALRVPQSRFISGHVTNKGVSKIRVGKERKPQYTAEDDRTSVTLADISLDDLSDQSIDWGIAQHRKHFRRSAQWSSRQEFLEQERLVAVDLTSESQARVQVTLAAVLLFGKVSTIQRRFPAFETVVVGDQEPVRIRKNIVDCVRELVIGESSILQRRLPFIPFDVLKELVVNAYIHRCYRTPSPIVINVSGMEGLEIKSPGDLLPGLTVKNLIYGVPVYRNLLLAQRCSIRRAVR